MARGAGGRSEMVDQIRILRSLNQQAAAVLIGVHARTLRDLDAPRNVEDRTYDGPELVKWMLARAAGEAAGADPDADASPHLERVRIETARKLKRENDRAEEMLIEVETVGMIIDEVGRVWRERVKSLQQVHGAEVGEVIADMVEDAFGGLKDGVERAKQRKAKPA